MRPASTRQAGGFGKKGLTFNMTGMDKLSLLMKVHFTVLSNWILKTWKILNIEELYCLRDILIYVRVFQQVLKVIFYVEAVSM
jgi:hypothetical protein